jgi:hypothetical protein
MTVYRVQVRGSGYVMNVDGGASGVHGFYVVHWVTAESPDEAHACALQLVRDSPKVAGQTGLRLTVDEMDEVGAEEPAQAPSGFIFFPDESPLN